MSFFDSSAALAATTHVDYIVVSTITQAIAAVQNQKDTVIFGTQNFLTFDDSFCKDQECHNLADVVSSASHGIDGYIHVAKSLPDGGLIIAGTDHSAKNYNFLILDGDSRKAYLAKMSAGSRTVERFIHPGGRVSYGLAVGPDDQIVLLSGAEDGHYELSIFDDDLDKKDSQTFGSGGIGDVAVTAEGNYIVTGFEHLKDQRVDLPAYWEFSPKLVLIDHKVLSTTGKDVVSTEALMHILISGENIYAVYGWENCPGCGKTDTSVLRIEKLNGAGPLWKQDMVYHRHARFFVAADGNPFMLDPQKDSIHRITFRQDDGQQSQSLLERPTSPTDCFPPQHYYEIVDLIHSPRGGETIVLTSNPMNDGQSGCVVVGKLNL